MLACAIHDSSCRHFIRLHVTFVGRPIFVEQNNKSTHAPTIVWFACTAPSNDYTRIDHADTNTLRIIKCAHSPYFTVHYIMHADAAHCGKKISVRIKKNHIQGCTDDYWKQIWSVQCVAATQRINRMAFFNSRRKLCTAYTYYYIYKIVLIRIDVHIGLFIQQFILNQDIFWNLELISINPETKQPISRQRANKIEEQHRNEACLCILHIDTIYWTNCQAPVLPAYRRPATANTNTIL